MAKQIRRRSKKTPVAVSEALQEFLASRQHLSIPTQEDYQWRLRAFASWCAQHQVMLDDISNAIVNDFVSHLKATHKPCKPGQAQLSSYTVSGYVRVIKTFLGWCAEQDEYNPHVQVTEVNKIKKPRVTEIVIDTFTSKQIDLLLDACNQEESDHLQMRARAIVALLVDTGIRASELCSLTIGNIRLDADDAYIRVHGKGDKWGEVGLGDRARKYVRAYVREYRIPTIEYTLARDDQQKRNQTERQRAQARQDAIVRSLVFVNRSGDPLTPHGLGQIIKRLGAYAGIEGVRCSPHTFRHTFAANFIRQGGDVYTLSKLLRHSSVSVTEEYLKTLQQQEARRGAKSVLDNL